MDTIVLFHELFFHQYNEIVINYKYILVEYIYEQKVIDHLNNVDNQ
jgi:hypothetical protein